MTGLRQVVAALIEKGGGVMTTTELTAAVLGARGSVADEPQRSQGAAAVVCAAVDTEMTHEGGRYTLHRGAHRIFIVAMPGLADAYTASPAARTVMLNDAVMLHDFEGKTSIMPEDGWTGISADLLDGFGWFILQNLVSFPGL